MTTTLFVVVVVLAPLLHLKIWLRIRSVECCRRVLLSLLLFISFLDTDDGTRDHDCLAAAATAAAAGDGYSANKNSSRKIRSRSTTRSAAKLSRPRSTVLIPNPQQASM